MANTYDMRVVEEGPRNSLVKITGTIDTSDISIVPAIHLNDFVNNDLRCGVLSGFRIDLVEWSMSNGIEMLLEWNALNPQQILPIAGRGRIHAAGYGGMIPDSTKAGYDGSINLKSSGFTAGSVQNYSIMLELVKLYKNV